MNEPKTLVIPRRAIRRRAMQITCLMLALAGAAGGSELAVSTECEAGVPHGNYTVKSASGPPRIVGSYADGVRSGAFTFFGAGGEKLVELPYTRGLLDGTVRAWHARGSGAGAAPAPKLVSDLSAGFVEGRHQTWYENGNRRSDFVIADGEIESAKTWNPDGSELVVADDSAFLQAEIESDFRYYERLEQVMDRYPPAC